MTELQNKVLEAAKIAMKDQGLFNGVCLDAFKILSDVEIERIGFANAVEEVIIDTMAWDCPMRHPALYWCWRHLSVITSLVSLERLLLPWLYLLCPYLRQVCPHISWLR